MDRHRYVPGPTYVSPCFTLRTLGSAQPRGEGGKVLKWPLRFTTLPTKCLSTGTNSGKLPKNISRLGFRRGVKGVGVGGEGEGVGWGGEGEGYI